MMGSGVRIPLAAPVDSTAYEASLFAFSGLSATPGEVVFEARSMAFFSLLIEDNGQPSPFTAKNETAEKASRNLIMAQ